MTDEASDEDASDDSPSEEAIAHAVERFRSQLRERPRGGWWPLVWLIVSLAIFMGTARLTARPVDILVAVAVIAFHELGHYLGMRIFGYRDVRMFFIPFFGGAVSGDASGVSSIKRAIVLLLGPLPGLVIAAVLVVTRRLDDHAVLGDAALILSLVNGLNLLPFEPLDGGKLVRELIAPRFRFVEILSLVIGVAGLAYLAWHRTWFGGWLLTGMTAAAIPHRLRSMRAVSELRSARLPMPARPEDAPSETLAKLLDITTPTINTRRFATPDRFDKELTRAAREIYDRAGLSMPPVVATVGLLSLQLVGFALALIGVGDALIHRPPGARKPLSETTTSGDGAFSVRHPKGFKSVAASSEKRIALSRVVGGHVERITFGWNPMAGMVDVADANVRGLLDEKAGVSDVRDTGVCRGATGRSLEWTEPAKTLVFRHHLCQFAVGHRVAMYEIVTPPAIFDAEVPVLVELGDAASVNEPSAPDNEPNSSGNGASGALRDQLAPSPF